MSETNKWLDDLPKTNSSDATVRQWSDGELASIKDGSADPRLATLFFNMKTYSGIEHTAFRISPFRPRLRSYITSFDDDEDASPVKFRALDDECAKWFLAVQYGTEPDYLDEIVITHREVVLT